MENIIRKKEKYEKPLTNIYELFIEGIICVSSGNSGESFVDGGSWGGTDVWSQNEQTNGESL